MNNITTARKAQKELTVLIDVNKKAIGARTIPSGKTRKKELKDTKFGSIFRGVVYLLEIAVFSLMLWMMVSAFIIM